MNKILLFLSLLIACNTLLIAQVDDEKLPTENQVVVKAFEAQLGDAQRISITPKNRDPIVKKFDFPYNISIVPIAIDYPAPKIRPLAKDPDPRALVYTNWLKLGYGILKRPFADVAYHLYLEDRYGFTLSGNYDGGKEETDNGFSQQYYQSRIAADGYYNLSDNTQVLGGAAYEGSNRSLYGYQSEESIELFGADNQDRQRKVFSIHAGLKNKYPLKEKFHYQAEIYSNVTRIGDQSTEEFNISIPIKLMIAFKEGQYFAIESKSEYGSSDASNYHDGFVSFLNPYLKTNWGFAHIKLGLAALYAEDESKVFPDVELSIPFVQRQYFIFAGADMAYQRNNIYNSSKHNPYIDALAIDNSISITRNIYAGVRTDIKGLKIDGRAGYQWIDNETFYSNTSSDFRLFNYNLMDGNAFFISGTFSYSLNDQLEWSGKLKQYIYDFEGNIAENLHLPTLMASSKLVVSDSEKTWHLGLQFDIADKIDALQIPSMGEEVFVKLKNQLDFSIDADYYLSDNFALYLEANNLFSRHYERWYLYEDFGANIIGGLKLKF